MIVSLQLRQHLNMKDQDQPQEISSFFSRYSITQIDPQTTLIQSSNALYLSKSIQLNREQTDIDQVIQSLQQHQTLNQNYLLTLINYQILKSQPTSVAVHTLYQYAKLTLQQEIGQRRFNNQRFSEQQLWAIIFSLTKSLQYLEKLGIAYGVLSCDKIFIDKKIKLLDPSAVGEDPFAIVQNRLYSPQILKQDCNADILKSDVFVLGLCVLQAALLLPHQSLAADEYDETRVKLYIERLQAEYPSELANLIRQMLQYQPYNRPSFTQIRQYLENTLEMTEFPEDNFNPLPPDCEDLSNELYLNQFTQEIEIYDSQQEEEQSCLIASLNEFQKAKIRFLNEESPSILKEVSRIEQNSRYSQSLRLQNSRIKGDRLSLISRKGEQGFQRKQTSKSIKEKVIKDMSSLQLQVTQIKDNKRPIPAPNSSSSYNHIFTSPKLLQQIQNSLKSIAMNRGRAKQNVYNGNY